MEAARSIGTRIDRRSFLKMGGALGGSLVGLSLLGCQPAAPASPTGKKEAVTAKAGGTALYNEVGWLPFFVGDKKGYFADMGIKHDFIEFKGGAESSRALEVGETHYNVLAISPTVNAYVKGAPFRIIASTRQAAGSILYVVPPASPIKSLKEIKGKSVSFSSPGALTDFFARASVKAAGYAPADVKLVPVGAGADSWIGARSGIIDVAWVPEGLGRTLEFKGEARVVWSSLDVVKDWQDLVVTTNENVTRSQPEVLRGLCAGLQRAHDFIAANAREAAKIWVEYAPDVDPKVADNILQALPRSNWTAKLSPEGIKVAEEGMREMGLVKERVPWDKIIDQQFLPENLRIDISKLTA